jgi:hypothetical protein
MKSPLHPIGQIFFGLFLGFAVIANMSYAQVVQPAPEETEKPASDVEKPADDAAKPKTAAGEAAEKPGDEAFGKADVLPNDPAVAALLAANPTTPSEWAKTAKILVDLHQSALAKQFLKKIVDAKLDGKQLAALGRELGSPTFVAMGRGEALQPYGKQLSDAVLEAMNAELQNPAKIAEAIKQLQDPSIETRTLALQELQHARKPAVAALIEVLADPKREAEFKNVRAALAMMGRQGAMPMIGIMESSDPKLKEQAIRVLGEAVAIDAKYFLIAPALKEADGPAKETAITAAAREALARLTGGKLLTKTEAVKLLLLAANLYLNRQPALPDAVDGKVELWQWDDKQKKCVISTLPVEDARLAMAARLAHDALTLAPEDKDARLIYWTATLGVAAYQRGLDQPYIQRDDGSLLSSIERELHPTAEESFADHVVKLETNPVKFKIDVKFLESLIDFAAARKHYPAAATAAEMLGKIGTADELLYPVTGQSILVRAIQQPDRRLRMAALQAIVKLKPEKPYPGSSNVVPALAYFAAGTGTRRALVAGPNLNNLPHLVSGLSAAGFKVELVNTGREVMQKLLDSPDYEIAMIDAGISNPPIEMLLQQIRRDDRSADVRVGVIARAGFFEKAEHAAASDPLTLDFPRPNDDDAVRWEVEKLAAIKPRDLVRPEERLREAGEALDLLAELSRSPKLYDVRRVQDALFPALKVPALSLKAVAVLANINSPEAQQALIATANRDASPMELRLAAVTAFRTNVETHGVLLTHEESRRQYDLYNQSEKSDKSVQKIFSLILDCLEAAKK